MKSQDLINQGIGGVVEQRLNMLLQKQEAFRKAVASNLAEDIARARLDLEAALHEVEKLRDFTQHPSNILGSIKTKHGEIAERMEVYILNARQLVQGKEPTGVIDSIPRTGPVDYTIDGQDYQMKFCNSVRKTFNEIIDHSSKYGDYVKNGGIYHIPKDEYEVLMKARHNEPVEGMRGSTLFNLKKATEKFEEQAGKPFEDIVKPSISNYSEVQISTAGKTIDGHERDLRTTTQNRIDDSRMDAEIKQEQANHITDPSWSESVKTAAIGAAIGGTFQGAIVIYQKLREGKVLVEFSKEDWEDVGISFAKGSLKGGVSGFTIYGLTRVINCPAPLASAIVTSIISVSSLFVDYQKGHISKSEFIEASYASCCESAICCAGAALGSFTLPPPFGAVVGTLVAQGTLKIVDLVCDEQGIIDKMEEDYNSFKQQLDAKIEEFLKPIFDFYNQFDNLVGLLSDEDTNCQLKASIELCMLVGVPEKEIIKNEKELNTYINE